MEDIAEDIADVAEAKVDVDTVGRWSVLLNVLGISGRVEEEDAQDAAEEVDMLCACPFFEDERCRVVELGISKLLKRGLFEFIVGVTLKRHRFAHRVVQHEHIHVKPSWIVSHSTIKRYELKVIREVASDAPSFRPIPDVNSNRAPSTSEAFPSCLCTLIRKLKNAKVVLTNIPGNSSSFSRSTSEVT